MLTQAHIFFVSVLLLVHIFFNPEQLSPFLFTLSIFALS